MRTIWILFKREMMSYFYSPIAYIMGVCTLTLLGGFFYTTVYFLVQGGTVEFNPMEGFFYGVFTWIVLLIVPPVITMRVFAEEKRTGTLESLMTTPVRDLEYVLAKFLGAYVFFLLLWVPTFNYAFVVHNFAKETTPLNLGPVIGGYLGVFLIGMLFVSIGCMASASTRNQIVAAVVAFAISCLLFLSGLYFFFNPAAKYRVFLEYFSILAHMREMARGIVEWKRLVFYLSFSAFFLFVTHRMVQSRRWKS